MKSLAAPWSRAGLAAVAGVALALAVPTDAVAASPGDVTVFTAGLTPGAQPGGLTLSGSTLWFAESSGARVGRITADGAITETPTLDRVRGLAASSGGGAWLAEGTHLQHMAADGQVLETVDVSALGEVYSVTATSDGNLWIRSGGNDLVRRTPDGALTTFTVTTDMNPLLGRPVEGPDGNLWLTEARLDKIARVTRTGVVTEWPLGSGGAYGASALAVSSDGAVWAAETYPIPATVVRVDPSGTFSTVPVPGLKTIATGPDGAIWFLADDGGGPRLGRIGADSAISEFAVALPGSVLGLATGPDLALWATSWNPDGVARIEAGLVAHAPHVTREPASAAVAIGSPVILRAAADGTPAPSVSWESSIAGGAWTPLAGEQRPMLTVVPQSTSSIQYRAVFVNPSGAATSNVASVRGLGQVGIPVIARSSAAIFPYRDGYHDNVRLTVTTTVPARGTLQVLRGTAVVWKATLLRRTRWVATWSGRSTTGRALPAGRYTVRVTVRGDEGSARSATALVTLSTRRLVAQPFVTVVSAQKALSPGSTGLARPGPVPGGLVIGFASMYGDIAMFRAGLPTGTVRFGPTTLYSCSTRAQQAGAAASAEYLDASGRPSGLGLGIGSRAACYFSDSAPPSYLYGGRTVRWRMYNSSSTKSVIYVDYFKLRGTRYVLQ